MIPRITTTGIATALMMTLALLLPPRADAGDGRPKGHGQAERSWPMFGGGPGRNMVNAKERQIPADWCILEGKHKNVKWMAELGSRTIGSPVVAHGKVFVATNNARPRDPKVQGHKAMLMAFRESDGQFLWQIAHDVPNYWGANYSGGLSSTPAVARGQLYYVTAAGAVVCADADHGKVLWRYDMIKELQVHPYSDAWCPACVAPPWSSPLVIGNLVFTATGNGIDENGKLDSARAPSFVALDRRTGKLVWQSNLPGANIIKGEWSSPAYADARGTPQVIFAGGDGVIYSFVPETGKLLWKCDCLPTRKQKTARQIDHQFIGSPVVVGGRLYVGLGTAEGWSRSPLWSYFLCLDITRKGDVSLKSYDPNAAANKGSALVWSFGGPVELRPAVGSALYFGRTMSTAAVHQGLVYITESNGYLHCLDAATGGRIWIHDFGAIVHGSPYLVDGRVFVGTDDGEVVVFQHGRAAQVVATIDMGEQITTTPVAVNGALYVTTQTKLFAISSR
jgi:outer membrane protein assembly factor BamB